MSTYTVEHGLLKHQLLAIDRDIALSLSVSSFQLFFAQQQTLNEQISLFCEGREFACYIFQRVETFLF